MYSSWLISLILVGEMATGKLSDYFWTMSNNGKTFETVDWSKFDKFDDDDEEDEEGEGNEESEEEDE
jgi:hypothetical protein